MHGDYVCSQFGGVLTKDERNDLEGRRKIG
jgi:hypothetical protein